MFKKIVFLALFAFNVLCFGNDKQIKIVCSFSIIADLVNSICDGVKDIKIDSIVKNEIDPHTYSPKPSDIKLIDKADIVFINGFDLECWIAKFFKNNDYKHKTFIVSKNIKPRAISKNFYDPHIWNDPLLAIVVIDNIEKVLSHKIKKNQHIFKKNAQKLKQELKDLYLKYKKLFDLISKDKKVILTTHDAFFYLSERFNLTIVSPFGVNTSFEPSAFEIAKLISLIKKNKVKAVFIENLSNKKIITQIASECNLKISGMLYADSLKPNSSLYQTIEHNLSLILDSIS